MCGFGVFFPYSPPSFGGRPGQGSGLGVLYGALLRLKLAGLDSEERPCAALSISLFLFLSLSLSLPGSAPCTPPLLSCTYINPVRPVYVWPSDPYECRGSARGVRNVPHRFLACGSQMFIIMLLLDLSLSALLCIETQQSQILDWSPADREQVQES